MKKIYSFIALMLMCFVGTANAQDYKWFNWTLEGENVAEIVPGEENFYVLAGGDATEKNADGELVPDGTWGPVCGQYVTGEGKVGDVVTNAVWHFIATGNQKNGHEIYVLKNVGNGMFLGQEGFVASQAKAFEFTARKGVLTDKNDITDATEWDVYSQAVSNEKNLLAPEIGAWVFCSPVQRTYLTFYGDPGFYGYIDTNNWTVTKVTPKEMTPFERFQVVYNAYGLSNFDPAVYPVLEEGQTWNPGYITMDLADKLMNTIAEVGDLFNQGAVEGLTDEEANEGIDLIESTFAELDKLVAVQTGYYVVANQRRPGYLSVKNGKAYCEPNSNFSMPTEVWTVNNAKYIWKVDNKEGKLLFQNVATKMYMSTGMKDGVIGASDKESGLFVAEYHSNANFLINNGGNLLNTFNNGDKNNYMGHWNDRNDVGNHFKFFTVDQAVLDSMTAKLEQAEVDAKLQKLVDRAKNDIAANKYANGFVENGLYYPTDSGLVKEIYRANATETSEGKESNLFDGDTKSFYHTSWSATDAPEGNHYIEVDLGKSVQTLTIKFTQRNGNHKDDITKFQLSTPASGDMEDPEWTEVLATSADSIIYEYASDFGDSTTFIGTYELNKPVQYIRFTVLATKANQMNQRGEFVSGPFWNMSEMRFYDQAETVIDPRFSMVPEAVREALNAAIKTAEEAIAAKNSTEAMYEVLDKALDAFWENYPDATSLKNALKLAQDMHDNATEGDELAQVAPGSKEVFQAAIDELKAEVEALAFPSLEQIKTWEEALDAAVAKFNAALHVPEAGSIYRIVCQAPKDAEDATSHAQWGAYISSTSADVNDSPKWKYNRNGDGAADRFNTLWVVDKDAEGYTFKNVANGLYMNNPYEGKTKEQIDSIGSTVLSFSAEPKHFQLEVASNALQSFVVVLTKGMYLNCQPTGDMVTYSVRDDQHAFYTFVSLDEEEFYQGWMYDVQPGKYQIITLPIDVENVETMGPNEDYTGTAYKVLGKKDGKLMLAPYDDIIPAGTPFIVKTVAGDGGENPGETTILVNTIVGDNDIDAAKALNYEYKPVVQNGMVSAPQGFTCTENSKYGILVNNNLIMSAEGDVIASGSGFFNNEIPATDIEGDDNIPMSDENFGTGTAVENVEIVKNVNSNVYTISGVKVRSNVKSANATKGLPKGIYIVGGEKVIVK